jgi:hypothetical protein
VKRLVFVMGMQRSGTNALFSCLNTKAVVGFNEAGDSPLFEHMMLRPEAAIRSVLVAVDGPVLVKPISETKHRSVAAVFDEFEGYDLGVVWIYRDPVNCYASHAQRWVAFRGKPEAFCQAWNQANRSALMALAGREECLSFVRYADLITDPSVLKQVGLRTKLPTRYRFHADANRGRAVVDAAEVALIEARTGATLGDLDQARCWVAGEVPPWERLLARVF